MCVNRWRKKSRRQNIMDVCREGSQIKLKCCSAKEEEVMSYAVVCLIKLTSIIC
jgi:hypothetical protein